MKTKTIGQGEAIKLGWNITLKNIWFFVGVLLFVFILNFLIGSVTSELKTTGANLVVLILANVVSLAIGILINLGLIKISLSLVRNQPVKFSDLFFGYNLILKQFASSIIAWLAAFLPVTIIGLGLAAAIIFYQATALIIFLAFLTAAGAIFAIFISLKFMFFSYFIVDKNYGPIESIKSSSQLTKKIKWELFLFVITLVGINILGMLALIVGLFITLPLCMIATAAIYQKLSEKA